ncbi:MAG: hypothetical protein LBM93_14495 [Oscillospiraceae bacterium]|jgi:hypothetical protein|nr:hypothetical protein [Oscillospiraceae bacterium]
MIKITSNPYQKKTVFQSYDANCGEWRDINSVNNANSGLLNEALCSGFFPFKVKQI